MRAALGAAVGLATTTALVIGLSSPVAAEPEPGFIVDIPDAAETSISVGGLPEIESQLGIGAALGTDPAAGLAVPGLDDATAALVRVSVLSAPADLTLLAAGAPALTVAAGGSGSTTLPLRVYSGRLALAATTAAPVRIEVLAELDGDVDVPGSVVVLDEVIARADTAIGLAGPTLAAGDDRRIGVVGGTVGVHEQGHDEQVVAVGVRAAFVTATVDTDTATVLHLDDQTLPIPAGSTSITTVVTPSVDGDIVASLQNGSGDLRLDIRAWVPEAPANAESTTVDGAFVPLSQEVEPHAVAVSDDTRPTAPVSTTADAEYSLTLVDARPTGETTVIDVGPGHDGRGRGAVIDAERGAQPQLMLTAVDGSEAVLQLRRGQTTAHVQPVGDFVAAASADARFSASAVDDAAAPTIDSDEPTAEIALDSTGTFTLTGTATTPDVMIDRIEIRARGEKSGDQGVVGTATARFGEDGLTWEWVSSAPESDDYTFEITLFDLAGAEATTTVERRITLAEVDDVLVHADTWVVSDQGFVRAFDSSVVPGSADTIVSIDDRTVILAVQPPFAPGDLVVVDATADAPEGFIGRVDSIDRVGDTWRVQTIDAKLTDILQQADIDETLTLDEAPGTEVPDAAPSAEDTVAPGEGDEPTATFVPLDSVDLSPVDDDIIEVIDGVVVDGIDETSGERRAETAVAVGPRPAASRSESVMKTSNLYGFDWGYKQQEITDSPGFEDHSAKSEPAKKEFLQKVGVGGGFALAIDSEIRTVVDVDIDVDIRWRWTGPRIVVEKMDQIVTTTSKTTKKFTVGMKVAAKEIREKKLSKTLYEFKKVWAFAAGPIPVVITFGVEIEAKANLSLSGSFTAEYRTQNVTVRGYTYRENEGFRWVDRSTSTVDTSKLGAGDGWTGDSISFQASLKASAGLGLELSLLLYDAAGVVAEVSLKLASGLTRTWDGVARVSKWKGSLDIVIAAGISAKLRIPIIGMELASHEIVGDEKKVPLWSGEHVTPWDDPVPTIGERRRDAVILA
ncbi:hypothetical protein MN032_02790 [Agromyces atrinae]|uniref:hypothetical protein n=1 Tax=Agromyces atrinae TaxID=592376 RepID=UPI001F55E97C|nr:hypothetical protein [Agromyces atrinae]MCI2956609.1 hypothetical protein [Agromyces atrinae]